jgi:hypothetical protein
VAVSKGTGLWIESKGASYVLDSPVVRRCLKEHLNRLLTESKAGKGLTADDLITRKVSMQMLDAFMSPAILPFMSYTFKAMIMLGRILGKLYTSVDFETCLPADFMYVPEIVYGVYSIVYACMHCTVIYSDPGADSKRGYLQDLVGHGMQQVIM